MSKKWTEAHPRDNAIADYKEFNRGYNEYKSSFNGGIDRTMTPSQAVDRSSVVDNAFHNMTIIRSDDMTALADTNTGATLGDFRGTIIRYIRWRLGNG